MRLGELLLQKGVITPEHLQAALQAQSKYGGRLGYNLVLLGYVDVDAIALALGEQQHVSAVMRKHVAAIDKRVLALFSARVVSSYKAIPIGYTKTKPPRVVVACMDPATMPLEELAFAAGTRVDAWVAPEALIQECLERYFGAAPSARRRQADMNAKSNKMPSPKAAGGAPAVILDAAPPVQDLIEATRHASATHSLRGPVPPPAGGQAPATAAPVLAAPPSATAAVVEPIAEEPVKAPVRRPRRALSPPPPPPPEPAPPPPPQPEPMVPAPEVLSPQLIATPPPHVEPPPPTERQPPPPISRLEPSQPPPPEIEVTARTELRNVELQLQEVPSHPAVPTDALDAELPSEDAWDVPEPEPPTPESRPLTAPPDALRPVIHRAEAAMLLEMATSKDQIGRVLEDWLRSTFGCGLVFTVKDGIALGWKGYFPDAEDLIEAIAVPLNKPSMLTTAHDFRTPFRGPPPKEGDKVQSRLWKVLRCSPPAEVLVCPVVLGKRVVNLLYAHSEDGSLLSDRVAEEAAALCATTATAYARIIRKGK